MMMTPQTITLRPVPDEASGTGDLFLCFDLLMGFHPCRAHLGEFTGVAVGRRGHGFIS